MNRTKVAKATFAVVASGSLLAIALLGVGPFEDPSHPSALPPWAVEPAIGRDGAPIVQVPLQRAAPRHITPDIRAVNDVTAQPPSKPLSQATSSDIEP